MIASTCLGFNIACDTFLKGSGVTIIGFILFVGCVLLLLSAIFGRTMGYLVLATSFFGWMFMLSALWTFGFWSQGLDTPVNLGPRGDEPSWQVRAAGVAPEAPREIFASYPDGEAWTAPSTDEAAAAGEQELASAVSTYLAEEANVEAGLGEFDPDAFQSTDFMVREIRFTTVDGASLAAARGFSVSGGPVITVFLEFDEGSEAFYSWIFLVGSLLGLAAHLPFLDRAERKRKSILTGGGAPEWHGPA